MIDSRLPMIATKTPSNRNPPITLPNSRRVYVEGELHPDVRVPLREISLAPTKDFSGNLEPNEPCASTTPAARGATRI